MSFLANTPSKAKRIPWTCRFEYVDKDGIKRVGKGKKFHVDGVEIELFPSGVLCGMLHRSRKALYKWEEHFGFPPALWRVKDDGKINRWYSRAQLVAIQAIYNEVGRLKGKQRSKLKVFVLAVRQVFYVVDIPKEKRVAPKTSP